ncbi:MAG: hypothetical protein EOP49_53215 [Sphingobacteriales bacterium]|nr:MAG: hypothetical protein EOP49_53215 [Sphingobacteriales bacterium]
MAKVALYLKEKSIPELIISAQNVQQKLTLNAAVFPQPPVDLDVFQGSITDLSEAQQAMIGGGTFQRSVRDNKMNMMVFQLKQLASYVDMKSLGDPVIINLAGFQTARRGPKRYDVLDIPLKLVAEAIGNGIVRLRWERVAHAKSYAVEYCIDHVTDDGWKNGTYNSAANALISGLLPTHRYFFRVCALGSESMRSAWSDVAMVIVS